MAEQRCPFCGCVGRIEEVCYPSVYAVTCESCGAIGPSRPSVAEAEASWNARPPFAGLPCVPAMIRRETAPPSGMDDRFERDLCEALNRGNGIYQP